MAQVKACPWHEKRLLIEGMMTDPSVIDQESVKEATEGSPDALTGLGLTQGAVT